MPVAGGGFEQCYNAQAVVAAGSMLVVAADVVQAPNDAATDSISNGIDTRELGSASIAACRWWSYCTPCGKSAFVRSPSLVVLPRRALHVAHRMLTLHLKWPVIPMALGFLYLVAIIDWPAGRFWRGACRTRWIRAFASRRPTKRWRGTARQKYSTPIRARSSPAPSSPVGSRPQASRFRWTDAVVSWTIFSSNGCGARSNTRKCI